MNILLTIHSIVRYLVTIAALALIVRLVIGLVKKKPYDKSARILQASFSGLMDAQALLGILLLIQGYSSLGLPRYRLEHATIMVLAVIVAHLPAAWKKSPDHIRTRNTLIAVIVSLILVVIGVGVALGWPRWWHITGI